MPAPGQRSRVDVTWESEMVRLDPDLPRDSKIEPEYRFSGKTFTAEPATRGAYADDD